MRQLLLRYPVDNASKRCDANPARKEYGCSPKIILKSQIAAQSLKLNSAPKTASSSRRVLAEAPVTRGKQHPRPKLAASSEVASCELCDPR